MRNHFHLVVETPEANLVAGMKWLLGVYTQRFNRRHQWSGHLFAGRYKAWPVEGSGGGYLRTVCDYVHLNPARAGLLASDAPLEHFPWSSYGQYLGAPSRRPAWLRVDRVLGEHAIAKDSPAGRREFGRQTEQKRAQATAADDRKIRQGENLGSAEFRQEFLEAAAKKAGPGHYGSDRFQGNEARAQRLVAEELERLGWKEAELARRKKGDRRKVALARRLRSETTMTLSWIAGRLRMGSWSYVSNLLRQTEKCK